MRCPDEYGAFTLAGMNLDRLMFQLTAEICLDPVLASRQLGQQERPFGRRIQQQSAGPVSNGDFYVGKKRISGARFLRELQFQRIGGRSMPERNRLILPDAPGDVAHHTLHLYRGQGRDIGA